MIDDALTRHFFTGFIRLHILYHAAKEPVYGAEITEELRATSPKCMTARP